MTADALRAALDYLTKPAGLTPDVIEDDVAFRAFHDRCEAHKAHVVHLLRAALAHQVKGAPCSSPDWGYGYGPIRCLKCGKSPDEHAPTDEQIAAYLERTGTYVTNDATREAAIADAIKAASSQFPVARVRTWTKNGEGHGELVDWLDGADALPDGEHDLYARSSGAEASQSNEHETRSAHPPEGAQTEPAGWKWVPIEPTTEMLDAGASESDDTAEIYKAMLAAAPKIEGALHAPSASSSAPPEVLGDQTERSGEEPPTAGTPSPSIETDFESDVIDIRIALRSAYKGAELAHLLDALGRLSNPG